MSYLFTLMDPYRWPLWHNTRFIKVIPFICVGQGVKCQSSYLRSKFAHTLHNLSLSSLYLYSSAPEKESLSIVWFIKRMRRVGHLCGRSALCTKQRLLFERLMTSRELKSRKNEHAVRGRTTRKEVEHFRNGSVRMPHERSTYERTYLSEPIENHIIPNELSNLNLDKKHLQKRHRIFRRDLEPSRIPVRTLLRLRNKSRKKTIEPSKKKENKGYDK